MTLWMDRRTDRGFHNIPAFSLKSMGITNVRKAPRLALSSSSEVRTEKYKNKITQVLKQIALQKKPPWNV